MTTRYERGRAIEYRIQRELEAVGYTTARAAGSKGKFDVLAWDDKHYRLVQAKSYIDKPGSFAEDIEAIRWIRCPANTRKEFWIWQHRRGWQLKLVIRTQEEGDCLLPIAEVRSGEEGRYNPTVIRADGTVAPLDQPVQIQPLVPAPAAKDSRQASGRSYGTPITLTGLTDYPLRGVLDGVRTAIEETGQQSVLFDPLPEARPKRKGKRTRQPSAKR